MNKAMSHLTPKQACLQSLKARFDVRTGLPPSRSVMPGGQAPHTGALDVEALFSQGLHEIMAASAAHDMAATAFALLAGARASAARPILAVTLKHRNQDDGRLYGIGLSALGLDPVKVVDVNVRTEKDLLWAVEEGATCKGLGAVIAILDRKERLYGFTASRRIKLRQEQSAVPVFLVRRMSGDATAATARWRVVSLPSNAVPSPSSNLPLPGPSRFRAELLRHAGSPPQTLEIETDASRRMCMVATVPPDVDFRSLPTWLSKREYGSRSAP